MALVHEIGEHQSVQRFAVLASLALHGAGLALLIGARCGTIRDSSRAGSSPVISVEVAAPTPAASPASPPRAPAFAAPAAPPRTARARRTRTAATTADRSNQLAITGVDHHDLGTGISGNSDIPTTGTGGVGLRGAVSAVSTAHVAALAPALTTLPLPPAPAPSRARPPRLIYPSRESPTDNGDPFLARVTIDRDGYVVGAHLLRGWDRPRSDQASSLIWRFRYAPALDDNGNTIRATIEQPFLVGP